MEEKIVTIINKMADYLNYFTDEEITGSFASEHFRKTRYKKKKYQMMNICGYS